jgi:hypothetical protein
MFAGSLDRPLLQGIWSKCRSSVAPQSTHRPPSRCHTMLRVLPEMWRDQAGVAATAL